MEKERIVFLDWLRVIACFMVILVHSTEPFYLGGEGTYIASKTDYFLCTFINSFVRCCVPLFVLASSYLLFPVKQSVGAFARRRASRILIPLAFWLIVYCLISDDPGTNLLRCVFNFCDPAGHLWFVYMLTGLYLLMPLLSPWAEKASRKDLQIFLGIWFLTTLIPFIRQASTALFGTSELWGEANWNEFSAFYYMSGFIGYLVLGYYLRRKVPDLSWEKTLRIALPAFLSGYAITAGWFGGALWMNFSGHNGVSSFPVNEPIDLAVNIETSWRFCTTGVTLMTIGLFLLIRKIKCDGTFYRHIILPVSKASYGAYLMHIILLNFIIGYLRPFFEDGFNPAAASVLCIFTTAILTWAVSCTAATLIRKIPYIGEYLA